MFTGYIDLSKRRVSHEEVLKCEENFAKGKAVSSIIQELLLLKTFHCCMCTASGNMLEQIKRAVIFSLELFAFASEY